MKNKMYGPRRGVFLDRDGVINKTFMRDGFPYPPATLNDFEFLPGIGDVCSAFKKAGFLVVVVTNQPDVGRGLQKREIIEAMHEEIKRHLPIDALEVCYDANDDSEFRKPKPGMVFKAARAHGIDLKRSYLIGDRWRDIDCGHAAGCRTILLDHGYRETLNLKPHYTVSNLEEAMRTVLDGTEGLENDAGL